MPSKLDGDLASVMDALTAAGAPLETEPFGRFGTEIPRLKNAPECLPDFFDRYCSQFADREFLIDGNLRLTFAEVHALAREAAGGLIIRHGLKRGERVGIAARNSANQGNRESREDSSPRAESGRASGEDLPKRRAHQPKAFPW